MVQSFLPKLEGAIQPLSFLYFGELELHCKPTWFCHQIIWEYKTNIVLPHPCECDQELPYIQFTKSGKRSRITVVTFISMCVYSLKPGAPLRGDMNSRALLYFLGSYNTVNSRPTLLPMYDPTIQSTRAPKIQNFWKLSKKVWKGGSRLKVCIETCTVILHDRPFRR